MMAGKSSEGVAWTEARGRERGEPVQLLHGLLATRKGQRSTDIFREDWMEPLFEALNAELDALINGQNPKGCWSGRWLQVLRQVVVEEVTNLLNLERQLRASLPQMTHATVESSVHNLLGELRATTREHEQRLETAVTLLGAAAAEKPSTAMASLLEGIKEIIHENASGAERDFSLVSAVLKIEDYKIVCYGCARTFAQILGEDAVVKLLQANAEDEAQTHAKLEYLAEYVNPRAAATFRS